MAANRSSRLKKRRAPLPEEVYPDIKEGEPEIDEVKSHELFNTTNGTARPRTLPLGEPVGIRRASLHDQISPQVTSGLSTSVPTDSEISRSKTRNFDHIKSLSDNEALDVRDLSDKAASTLSYTDRHGRKRHSSEDLKQLQRQSVSSSFGSQFNLSDRSFSLNSISSTFSTDYVDSQMVDQEGIVTLTVHVRKFSDALSKLRNAFSGNGSDTESDGTAAYEKLCSVLLKKTFLKDIAKLSPDAQTSCLEGFHSTLNHWHPKMTHFSWMGTYCRHIIAILHFNENLNRDAKKKADGETYYQVTYPKFKLGEEVVREVPVPPTYGYVSDVMRTLCSTPPKELVKVVDRYKGKAPQPLCEQFPERRSKEAAIHRHHQRMENAAPVLFPPYFTDNDANASQEMQVKAHKCLGKVLSNLKEVIHKYSLLESKEILEAAGQLITKVKSHNYDDTDISDEFYQSIDKLALVFSSSVSDYLMGDQEMASSKTGEDGDDGVDEFADDGDDEDLSEGDMLDESLKLSKEQHLIDALRDQETDLCQVLIGMESGVEFCLQWTKCWSKYVKDIANYVEKRAQLEAEYTKQLTKLAQTTRSSIAEESYLPFQSTFFTALEQDLDYSQRCQQTLTAISGSKFMSPLMQRRSVHDRARKDMKDEWTKMCKQLHDSVSSVKATKSMYYKRKQELEKLNTKQGDVKETKDFVFSTNKGKKEDDLRSKVEEAKQFYSTAVELANQTQSDSEKTKERIVGQTKQLVNECDRTFRSVTRKYFDMQHDLAVPTPIHFKTLAESCQGYEPGKQFEEFVRFQQSTARPASRPVFQFEQYNSSRLSSGGLGQELENTTKLLGSPLRVWANNQQFSDNECGAGSPGPSPSGSPQSGKKTTNARPSHTNHQASTDEESDGEARRLSQQKTRSFKPKRRPKTPAFLNKVTLSKAAETHTFHKIRSPAKCSECDSYVFSGVECAQCGLSCHKKCLESLGTDCGHSRRKVSPLKRMKTFGVYFSEDGRVPVLVTKCIHEINRRGLRVKGIYRVSGVKSKMEGLCQEFETNADAVDLSSQPPHLIASVLKLYIRQLPEPLMTKKLYLELIQLAKDTPHLIPLTHEEYENENDANEFRRLLEKLKEILTKLPRSNYLTTALLIKHLHKVANEEEFNQMSSQNLAIVFGPTILRQESLSVENSITSLSSLVDMQHQTRIVALLIVNPQLFSDDDEDSKLGAANGSDVDTAKDEPTSLPETPVEQFVFPAAVDDAAMPDLYGTKSDRVRGEGPSPMDKLESPEENVRNDRGTSKTSERIDVKGEATVFDDTGISLPGSLEQQNKSWPAEDDDISDRETDITDPPSNINQESSVALRDFSFPSSSSGDVDVKRHEGRISTSSHEDAFILSKRHSSSSSANNELQIPPDIITTSSDKSQDEQDENFPTPQPPRKELNVGKSNVVVADTSSTSSKLSTPSTNNISPENNSSPNSDDQESTPRASPSKEAISNGVSGTRSTRIETGDSERSDDQTLEQATITDYQGKRHHSLPLSSIVTSNTLIQDKTVEADISVPMVTTSESQTSDVTQLSTVNTTATSYTADVPQPSTTSTTTTAALRTEEGTASGDELGGAPASNVSGSRKRSSTFDNGRELRKPLGTRSGVNEKRNQLQINNRVRVYGSRSRNHRVCVKDQVKQLEQRGTSRSDANKSASLPLNTRPVQAGKSSGAKGPEDNTESEGGKDEVDAAKDTTMAVGSAESPPARVKEPLARLRPKEKDLTIDTSWGTPAAAATSRPVANEKFRALKMDINLDSQLTPSSDSSSEETCSGQEQQPQQKEFRLNPWSGKGLTPRNSNHAPEFV